MFLRVFFSELWNKITGRAIDDVCDSVEDCPDEISYYCQVDSLMKYTKSFDCFFESCEMISGSAVPVQVCNQGCADGKCVGEEEICVPVTCVELGKECGV